MNKKKLIDIHGIHLLDFEPYYVENNEEELGTSLSCSIVEAISQIKLFAQGYSGRIGVLPYQYSGFKRSSCIPFEYEFTQLNRLSFFLKNIDFEKNFMPFFPLSSIKSKNYNKFLESKLMSIETPIGFKYHPLSMQEPIINLLESSAMSILNEKSLPLIIHCGSDFLSNPNQLFQVANRYPKISFIAAHLGGLKDSFLRKLINYENIYTDSAILSYITSSGLKQNPKYPIFNNINCNSFEDLAIYLVDKYSLKDKILFGSDYPWTKLFETTPKEERQLLLNSNLDKKLIENWSYKNANDIILKQN